jgi:hypothetical protein
MEADYEVVPQRQSSPLEIGYLSFCLYKIFSTKMIFIVKTAPMDLERLLGNILTYEETSIEASKTMPSF